MTHNGETILAAVSGPVLEIFSLAAANLGDIDIQNMQTTAGILEGLLAQPTALLVLEPALDGLDEKKVAAGLSRQENGHPTPLLLVTDSQIPRDLASEFPSLLTDHLAKPLSLPLVNTKIRLFLELHRHRHAVHQSMDELERLYARFSDHHTASAETNLKKDLRSYAMAARNQVQPLLNTAQAGTYLLHRAPDMPGRLKPAVSQIRNTISQVQRIIRQTARTRRHGSGGIDLPLDDIGRKRRAKCLYAVGTDAEFHMLKHAVEKNIRADLIRATGIEQALKTANRIRPDIIFVDHRLTDGTGLDLLAALNRLPVKIPTIFLVDVPNAETRAQALSEGAETYLLKEELTGGYLIHIMRKALERSRLTRDFQAARDRISLVSSRDRLTRLYNRRYFDRTLNTELSKSKRYHFPLSILLVDVDRFKSINEAHGYETGDLLLADCARRIRPMVRNLDVVCRYSGEAFGIILPNTDIKGAKTMALRILEAFSQHEFEVDGACFSLTVSIGVAAYTGGSAQTPKAATSAPARNIPFLPEQDMVKLARTALENAKAEGGGHMYWKTI